MKPIFEHSSLDDTQVTELKDEALKVYEDKKDISHALLSYGQVLKYNPEFQLTLDRVAVLKKLR